MFCATSLENLHPAQRQAEWRPLSFQQDILACAQYDMGVVTTGSLHSWQLSFLLVVSNK